MKHFSYGQMFTKGLKYGVLFALPVFIDRLVFTFPDLAQLSLGAILVMFSNWLKHRWGLRVP